MERSGELFAGTADAISDEERRLEAEIALQRRIVWTARWPKDRIYALRNIKDLWRRLAELRAARLRARQ